LYLKAGIATLKTSNLPYIPKDRLNWEVLPEKFFNYRSKNADAFFLIASYSLASEHKLYTQSNRRSVLRAFGIFCPHPFERFPRNEVVVFLYVLLY